MSITFPCPSCDKTLRVSDDSAGRKARCPECGKVVGVPDANGMAKRPVVKKARRVEEVAEEDYEVVEDEPGPRKRKPADDADDAVQESVRPRPRKKVADDMDGDDAPAAKRARSRSEEDEEDEDFDRPRPRKKRRKKSAGKAGLVIGISVAAVLVLAGLVMGGLWYFEVWPFSAGLGAHLRYLPDDCYSISSTNHDQIYSSKFYKRVKEEFPETAKSGGSVRGFADSDVSRVTEARAGKDTYVTIVTTKKAVSASDVKTKQSGDYQEEKVEKYTLYYSGTNAFCLPEGKVIIFGPTEALKKILKRGGKPELSESFKRGLDQANFSKSIVSVSVPQSGSLSVGIGGLFGPGDLGNAKSDAEAMCQEVSFSSDISTTATYLCKDSKAAEELKKKLDENLKKAKENTFKDDSQEETMKSIKVSQSGSKVTLTSSVKLETVISQMKKAKLK